MREYVGCPPSPYQVAFVPGDPPRLAAATNTAAYIWLPDQPEPIEYAWNETAWGQPRLETSPDGRWLVAGPAGRLRGWDLAVARPGPPLDLALEDELIAQFTEKNDCMTAVFRRTARGGPELLAVDVPIGKSKRRKRPRPKTLPLPAEIQSDVAALSGVSWRQARALSGDGRWLALSTVRRTVHLWDIDSGAPPRAINMRGTPGAISLSPDGSRLVLDAGTTVYIHDTATLELVTKWKAKYCYTPELAWSADGRLLARIDRSTTVRIFDPATGKEIMAVGTKRGILVSAAFSPDGLTIATGTHEGPVRVWDVE